MMRQLGASYKTAWLVKHKLMQTMLVREAPRSLTDRVEIDDAYLGGERAGRRGTGLSADPRTKCRLWRRYKSILRVSRI